MARRRTDTSVSLFPFLAVLVCTMGALILLLLVTTRRIRQKQTVAVVAAVPGEQSEAEQAEPEIRTSDEPDLISQQILKASQELPRLRALLNEARRRQQDATDAEEQARQRAEELEEAAATLQLSVDELRTSGKVSEDELEDARLTLRQLTARQQQLSDELAALEISDAGRSRQIVSLTAEAGEAKRLTGQYRSALIDLRADIEHRQMQLESAQGTPATVVDFSNPTGTARTPIIVEVNGAGYRLPATDILVRAEDLKSFPATDNPLLSAVLAVDAARAGDSVTTEPYVLLLVRPSGILGFYPAQRSLKTSGIHFGYELVSDQQKIAAATPAYGEAEAVRAAVLASLMRRDKYYAAAGDLRDRIGAIVASRRPPPVQDVFRDRARPGEEMNPTPADRQFTQRPLTTDAAGRAFIPDGRSADARSAGQFPFEKSQPMPKLTAIPPQQPEPPMAFRESGDPLKQAENRFDAMMAAEESADAVHEFRAAQNAAVNAESNAQYHRMNKSREDNSGFGQFDRSTPAEPQPLPADQFLPEGQSLDDFWNDMQPLAGNPVPANAAAAAGVPGQTFRPDASSSGVASGGSPGGTSATDLPPEVAAAMAAGVPGQKFRPDASSFGVASGGSPGGTSATGLPPEVAAAMAAAAGGVNVTRRPVTIFLDPEYITVGSRTAKPLQGKSFDETLSEVIGGLYEEIRDEPQLPESATLPLARFVVSPGAHTLYLQLAARLYELNIPAGSMMSFEKHVTPHAAAPHSAAPQSAAQVPQEQRPALPRPGRVRARRRSIHL